MKFRRREAPHILGFQIAPMVDILLVLLCFFIVTWNFARRETELDVKVPSAQNATESNRVVNQIVVNVRNDGTIVLNQQPIAPPDLSAKLKELATLFPDYAVILRVDERAPYRFVVRVLDIFREANIWNIAFATARPE